MTKVYITKPILEASNESVYEKWGNVTYGSYNGSLQVSSQDDKKTYVSISFMDVAYTHIFEAINSTSVQELERPLKWLTRFLSAF